ncbi:pentatricopeptide repeat-containing protein, partial [Trifolium pratense]
AFELLSSQVGRLPEEQYLGYFMSGLKPAIRRRVRTLNPKTRMQMMRMAKDVEEELKDEDDEETRLLGKKSVGRIEGVGSGSKFRSGYNPAQKEMTRSSSIKTRKSFYILLVYIYVRICDITVGMS